MRPSTPLEGESKQTSSRTGKKQTSHQVRGEQFRNLEGLRQSRKQGLSSQVASVQVLGPAVKPNSDLVAGRSDNLQGDITKEAGSSSQILRRPINSLSSSNGVLPEEMQTNHLPL